jgi:hypothetical protein
VIGDGRGAEIFKIEDSKDRTNLEILGTQFHWYLLSSLGFSRFSMAKQFRFDWLSQFRRALARECGVDFSYPSGAATFFVPAVRLHIISAGISFVLSILPGVSSGLFAHDFEILLLEGGVRLTFFLQ